MGVDGVVAVEHGGVVVKDLLHHVAAQAHAPPPVVAHQVSGGLVDGEAVAGGAVLHVADGEDAVVDALGQEGDGAYPHHDHQGDKAPVLQGHKDHHRQRQANPAGAGERVPHCQQTGAQGGHRQQLPPPALGVEEQREIQGDKHGQQLGEVVGVVEEGVDAPGHIGVERHVLLGGHHVHPNIALVTAVQGGHRDAQHRQHRHGLELLVLAHRAHQHQHQQEPGDVEREEPHGVPGGQGGDQGVADEAHIQGHIGPQPVQLQPVLGPRGAAQDEQGGHPHRAQQAEGVFPQGVGGHEHHQHQQPQKDEAGPAHGGEEAEGQAAVPHPPARLVDPFDQGAGQVDDGREQAAGQAVGPGLRQRALPPDHLADPAARHAAADSQADPGEHPAGDAPRPAVRQHGPDGQDKAHKGAVLRD